MIALPASTLANTPVEGNQRFHLRTESLWIPVTKPGRIREEEDLVTTFDLSHILTNTLNNVFYFLSKINIQMARYSLFVLKMLLNANQPTKRISN